MITRERLKKISSWREKYGDDHNVMLTAAEAEEMARRLLAAEAQEPVADVVAWSSPNEERTCDIRWRRHDVKPGPLYTTSPTQQVTVPVYEKIQALASEFHQLASSTELGKERTDLLSVYQVLHNLPRRGYAVQVCNAMNPLTRHLSEDDDYDNDWDEG